MPLASTFALQFYGPACATAVGTYIAPSIPAEMRALARLDAVGTAVAFSPLARATQGRKIFAVGASVAFSPLARMQAIATMGAVGKVNSLSQTDVTGAVLEAEIEPGVSLKQVLRVLVSVAAGKTVIDTSGPSPVVRFRDLIDAKNRVTATMDGSERVAVVTDLT